MRPAKFVRIAGALALLALVACTGQASGARPSHVAHVRTATDVLFLGTDHGPASANLATGTVVLKDPSAVPAPDGSRLYDAKVLGMSTAIRVLDSATGNVLGTRSIIGDLSIRVASESGRAIALMAPLPAGVDTWDPIPRHESTIVVADPMGSSAVRRYRLRGNFEPEAFAVDDSRLFLIQY